MAHGEPRFQAAPWTLQGEAVVAFKPVRSERVRRLVPADARVLPVLPGRTLALLYLANYRQSPVGEYREFIFAPALIWRGGRVGLWISHIFVDNDLSLAAGREIWALPKQSASMQWSAGRMRVDGPQVGLELDRPSPRRSMQLPFIGTAMSSHEGVHSRFTVRGAGRVGFARATVDIRDEIGLGDLGFGGLQTLYVCSHMQVTIGRPRK